ncbi:glutathione S-transferase N-terminal domain-containing protein [Loktanella sp. SALINAS62]|uniref:glutathione S-transferase N-terminal domain-containing protein n=1 Tax=Loktanella sp. SALINAS62 TaxID=2706124 RepID=UPI001B8CD102|nr:glutathione S-transferase N-terminal domain-containing protein [Loktanella sp. SALINAS62]MBS1303262.1 glutathione S-transferase [Loktanella sp. SALINAS62]
MSDFTLYYWPVPFRGEFVRALLAQARATVDEPDIDAVSAAMQLDPRDQPVPHMAPPMLVDNTSGEAVAEMPAICLWLGERFDLLPRAPHPKALALKIVNDANDVLDEMTLDGGRSMWTPESWADYRPRLRHWMAIWEATMEKNGFSENEAEFARIVTATLWGTMTERLPELRSILDQEAPRVAKLTDATRSNGPLAVQAEESRRRFGDTWCGGDIEKSLRRAVRT